MTWLLALGFLESIWDFVQENGAELAEGLKNTLKVSAIAMAGAFVVGLVLGAARAHRVPVISQLAAVYVEVIRNTPILVQIFMLYYALPQFGIRLDAFTVAWLSVTIWGGAFNTENFRAGFEAVPVRYREAGAALGFRGVSTFLNVTLPIGGRIALPSSINTYISVVKNTSLMYVIAYPELTTVALQINALTLETTETFTVLAVTYLVIVWSLSAVIRLLESHLALPEEREVNVPEWTEPVARYVIEEGLVEHAQAVRDRARGKRAHRHHARHASHHPLLADAGGDPPLHRGLARPADPRDDLHHLLRPAGRQRQSSGSTRSRPARSALSSGEARRWPRPRAAPSARSRASSTRPRRHSASAGSAGTRS